MRDLKAEYETALSLLEQGRREAALAHFESCLRDALASGDASWIAPLATNAAFICEKLKRWEAAISYYSLALEHKDERHLHLAIANSYRKVGDAKSERSHLERCLYLASVASDLPMLNKVRDRLAQDLQ
jgi:tetratricopeptide (TPR) repeat protein